jgi:hypothetical protein
MVMSIETGNALARFSAFDGGIPVSWMFPRPVPSPIYSMGKSFRIWVWVSWVMMRQPQMTIIETHSLILKTRLSNDTITFLLRNVVPID